MEVRKMNFVVVLALLKTFGRSHIAVACKGCAFIHDFRLTGGTFSLAVGFH